MTSAHDTGQIIAFYSYKGGTGRTMALANTAWILASNGLKVLAVDWDLESPGLHRFFHPFLDENTVSSTTGVVDIISDYMWATAKPHDDQDWHLQYARVLPHAVSLNWRFPGEGTLDFVSAGQQNRDYSAMPSIFDWDNFYERLGGGQFIAALRADMKANYDYILIDSRTGLSDIADICTIALPDILVDCFTMSDQSINGAAEVARHIDARYPDKRIRILPVLMRVDDGEKKKVDTGRLHARSMFEGFPKGLTAEETSAYWGSVEIPYKRFYAFEETLATFGDEPGSPGSMLAAFERLTAAITGGVVSAFPPLEDAVRTRWLDMFTRRQPARQPDVLISYAPEDRMWADWVAALLEQAGFRVTVHALHEPDIADDVEHARFTATIAILSAAYARAFHSWASVQEPAADGPSDMIVLRVTDVRLTPPFNLRPPADLVRLGQDDAIEVVLRAVSRLRSGHDLRVAADSLSVRYPGTAPTLWNVGTRNAAFTGRNATLETLRNELLGSNKAVVLPQALYGLGGVGKTQVALEYAHRFAADYDVVWWISAEQRDLISPQLAELARQMGLPVTDSVVETAEAARDALRRGEPWSRWLLIFDNAEDPEDIEPFLPGGGFGHVIVTSRNQLWSSVASPLEVDVFSLDESVEHLIRRVPRLSRAEAEQVAEALGNLPLAVEQAAAWLSETGLPASEYVWELQTQAHTILSLNKPGGYPEPVAATWKISLEQLRRRSPAAERLLQLCAYLSPDPISLTLIYSDEMIRALLPFDPSLRGEKLVLGRVIREIGRFALAKIDQGSKTLQVHRLVQAVIRDQMSEEDVETVSHQVHHILVAARPTTGEVDDPENWPQYDLIWPHLLPSDAEKCVEEETRQLLTERVRYWWKRGEYDRALQLGQRLADYWETKFGQFERQRLHMLFNVANVMRSLGRFKEARELDEWVRDQQIELLGDDHPHTLMTINGLAADLRALGDFQGALAMDKINYEQWKEVFGEDYARTLNSANNLAISYRLVGDWRNAKDLAEETFARMTVVFGAGHPNTLGAAQNLARDLREAGEYSASVELLRRTLRGYAELHFDDYPEALRAAKSLAVSLRRSGDLDEALRLAQDTYDRYQRLFPAHPESWAAALELACCLSALGDEDGARDMAASVLEDYSHRLGPQHPYTLVARNNLVTYLRGTGDPGRARDMAQDTLAQLRERCGDTHPFALSCAINLANCAADLGDHATAETLERQSLTALLTTLGRDHPDTLACQANLAITLRSLGRVKQGEQLKEETLAALGMRLGDRHPSIRALHDGIRVNRDLEPQPI